MKRSTVLFAAMVLALGPPLMAQEGKDLGEARLGSEAFEFRDQVAFQAELTGPMGEDETMTVVLLSVEPIDRATVVTALREDGMWQGPDCPRLQLRFRGSGRLHQVVFQGDGNNVIQPGFEFESSVELQGKKAQGGVKTKGPLEFFDDEFELSVTVDTERLEP